MNTTYNSELKAHLSLDDNNRVRHIRHSQEYWPSEKASPRLSANDYLKQMAGVLQIPNGQLNNLNKRVSFVDPREQGVEYQLHEEKSSFDSTMVAYFQTYMNVPVWRKGLSVTIKQNPNRVVDSINTSQDDVRAEMPSRDAIERYRRLFESISSKRRDRGMAEEGKAASPDVLMEVLNPSRQKDKKARAAKELTIRNIKLLDGRFFIYRYDPDKRFGGAPRPPIDRPNVAGTVAGTKGTVDEDYNPFLDLPPVDDRIKEGQDYMVAELRFETDTAQWGHVVWLILVELETGSILFVKALTSNVDAFVYTYDPITSTGDATKTSNQAEAVLDDFIDTVTLEDLVVSDPQELIGTYVEITNVENPNVAAPTEPAGTNFEYAVRSNNFAAVNAYYHQTELFQTIESLGFPIATYFDGTTFPIPVDHRGMGADGNTINAHWSPNGTGGTAHQCYALADTTPPLADNIGRAVDKWVHWHEMAGHGSLGDHVNDGNFPFAHSAGDGLAALQNDPESMLRALPLRFRYAPFRPGLDRFFGGTDRELVDGWGWDGTNDLGMSDGTGYRSEQILAATHFEIYRSMGGDSTSVNRRWFASRMMTYLILRGISELSEAANADTPLDWCEKLMAVDLEDWTSEGLSGGAYNKVIRWAFEKRGLYQPPGAPSPVTTAGDPPEVDVYLDDGRAGEYQYQPVHWHNQSMWNRNANDGLAAHQNAIEGATNYMYGKIKNRGTTASGDVTVRAFHSLPGAGLTWPTDFVEMDPVGGLVIPGLDPDSTEEATVGPFEWVPNVNVHGHDCVLMIASADGDPSNIDNFTAGDSIQEWRLVPNDNNVGQRNVQLVAAESEALLLDINGAIFFAGNNLTRAATMELKAEMPEVLRKNGWRLEFANTNERFRLKPGEKRKVELRLVPGTKFTASDIRNAADRNINVNLFADGMLLGGMTYAVDPDRVKSSRPKDRPDLKSNAGQDLLDCLKLPIKQKVKKVCLSRVSVDLILENDCDCE